MKKREGELKAKNHWPQVPFCSSSSGLKKPSGEEVQRFQGPNTIQLLMEIKLWISVTWMDENLGRHQDWHLLSLLSPSLALCRFLTHTHSSFTYLGFEFVSASGSEVNTCYRYGNTTKSPKRMVSPSHWINIGARGCRWVVVDDDCLWRRSGAEIVNVLNDGEFSIASRSAYSHTVSWSSTGAKLLPVNWCAKQVRIPAASLWAFASQWRDNAIKFP